MVTGSGALVVHRQLEARLPQYRVNPFSPLRSLFLPSLRLLRSPAEFTHTAPDFGVHAVHPDSKLIATFHNFYLDAETMTWATPAQKLYYRRVLQKQVEQSIARASALVAVSEFTAKLVQAHFPGTKIDIIKNGVDIDYFSRLDTPRRSGVTVLFVGNLSSRKGADVLYKVAEMLPDNCTMRYIAPRSSSATERSSRLSRLAPVPYEEMPNVYQQCDILFFPTLREGLSLAALEAMACGLPVVTTDCSSMPELVVPGEGGFLHNPGDVAGMVGSISLLAGDAEMRAGMGLFNRARIEQGFSLDRVAAEYRSLFASLI